MRCSEVCELFPFVKTVAVIVSLPPFYVFVGMLTGGATAHVTHFSI